MAHSRAITLVEVIVIVGSVLLLIIFLLAPSLHGPGHRELRLRTICGTRLNGIYKALNNYSVANQASFPMVGGTDPTASAIGFADGDRSTGLGAKLDNNVTAPLWMIVRDGSTSPQQFICPANELAREDPAGLDSLARTYDFIDARALSFSVMNMRHAAYTRHWDPWSRVDWALMADDNNNSAPDRHTYTTGASAEQVRRSENNPWHRAEGQNVMFGDGHVSFQTSPFAGPGEDNIYAIIKAGRNAPPSLGNSDGDAAADPQVAAQDVVLLPITGNGGGAGSLDPND